MSDDGYNLPAFVADLRAALRADGSEDARLAAGAEALARLLANPHALDDYRWVLEQGRGPWLLHRDEECGFVVTLLLKPRATSTQVHHHAEAWTLYGVFDGAETVHRYDRHDDRRADDRADVRHSVDHLRQPGEVEIEPPFAIHNESTGAERDTIAIAVRGRDLATIQQEWFDLAAGTVTRAAGRSGSPLPSRSA